MTPDEIADIIGAQLDAEEHRWRAPRTFDFHTADNAEFPFVGVYEVDEQGEAGRDIVIFPIARGGVDAAEASAVNYIQRIMSTLDHLRERLPAITQGTA